MEMIEDPAITFSDASSLSIRFPDPGALPKSELMQNQLTPTKGVVTVNKNMRVGYFAQHHVDSLDMLSTCVDCVQAAYTGMNDQDARGVLGRFGISGDMALRRVKTLSGGQK